MAAFASWHKAHSSARAALSESPQLPAHVALEVYSVLTRLPPPHRATGTIVVDFLRDRFRQPLLSLPASDHLDLMEEASAKGITGGALYDALIAATTKRAGAILLTRDERATRTYDALGAPFRLIR